MKLPKTARLRKRQEFLALRKGERRSGTYLSLQMLPDTQKKLGLSVSRKFGSAVVRNRFKRLVREAFRQSALPSYALNIFPHKTATRASLEEIKQELCRLTEKRSTEPQSEPSEQPAL